MSIITEQHLQSPHILARFFLIFTTIFDNCFKYVLFISFMKGSVVELCALGVIWDIVLN